MNIIEAMKKLQEGKKIRIKQGVYIYMDENGLVRYGGENIFLNGNTFSTHINFNDEWEIYEDE